jgi:hypothetical protein
MKFNVALKNPKLIIYNYETSITYQGLIFGMRVPYDLLKKQITNK